MKSLTVVFSLIAAFALYNALKLGFLTQAGLGWGVACLMALLAGAMAFATRIKS